MITWSDRAETPSPRGEGWGEGTECSLAPNVIVRESALRDLSAARTNPSALSLSLTLLLLSFLIASPAFSQQPKKKGISVGEPPADHSSEAELASFKVLNGFEINLFASEIDDIPNPIAIRWDERGRLWVLQTSVYPQPKPDEKTNDKIVILEDLDHDGKSDKRIVFADGLCQPMGMELAPCPQALRTPNAHSVYVGEGEKLWLFHDDDGDDKVDRREVVFSGFGTGDTHQCLNSFVWSPDGALVMHQGLHCYSKVSTPWGTKTLYGAGFWHYRPGSVKLEPYPTGMPLNPWGTVFTNEGQPIMVAGAAGMFWARPMEVSTADTDVSGAPGTKGDRQHIPHFLLERLQLPYAGQCVKTPGLTKFCGVDLVGNSHWPKEMQGEIVVGGFFENKVFRYQLRDDPEFPSGIEAVEQPALIVSDNVAFRPIDIRFGPDGACYIADWYDPIIGHYQASFRHPNRDKKHGRIWRVVAKGRALSRPSPLGTKQVTGKGLNPLGPDALNGQDRWRSYQIRRLLASLTREEAVGAVAWPLGMDESVPPEIPQSPSVTQTQKLIEDLNAFGRERQLRREAFLLPLAAVESWFGPPTPQYYEDLFTSERASTRARAIAMAGQQPQIYFGEIIKAVTDPSPRVRLEAVVAAAKVKQPEAIKIALKVLDKPMDSFIERALWLAVHATKKQWHPLTVDFMKDMAPSHIAFLIKREGSADLREMATAMLKQPGLPASVREGLTLALAKDDSNGSGLNADETTRLKQAGNDATKLEALAASATSSAPLRRMALATLAKVDPSYAGAWLAGRLGEMKDLESMKALLAPALPVEAVAKALATRLKEKPCTPDAAKLVLRVLTSTGRSEPELSTALTGILGTSNTVPAYDPAWVSTLVAEVKAGGNPVNGKAVFASTLTNCTACHSIAKTGGIIGPELDAVGRGVPMELLIEAVVWPGRQIKEGYLATSVVTKDGRRLQGYKVSEANGELGLRDFIGGVSKLLASEITSRTDAGSLMPEGLVALMTREELRDLIAYLASLGR